MSRCPRSVPFERHCEEGNTSAFHRGIAVYTRGRSAKLQSRVSRRPSSRAAEKRAFQTWGEGE